MKLHHLSANALVAALYVAFTYLWGWAATGPAVNVRLATSLYVLPALDPALLWGPAVGNAASTFLTGGHPVDAALGLGVGLLAGLAARMLGRLWRLAAAPLAVAAVPTLFVPLWVAWLYHAPLPVAFASVSVGQGLSALAAWLVVLPAARRVLAARVAPSRGGRGGRTPRARLWEKE